MSFGNYVGGIIKSANTIFEGMAVTFSHLFREPITIQYPDRTERPVKDMLPARYRGFLEVNLDICGGCKRCEKACPINCIVVEMQKDPETKKMMLTRFDIDISKCMFCGLCAEACEDGATGAIRHTREFEGACGTLDGLVFRYIEPGKPRPLYKAPKDPNEIPTGEVGPYAREARERALRDNPEVLEAARESIKKAANE
jgi:formate hydrogenlyase subunit 6/NADH:ubiquinone oxidoreductase subunit I